jgi:hypothetical protein
MDKLQALLASRDTPVAVDGKRFAAELAHLLKTPGYTTDKSSMTARPEVPRFEHKKEAPMPDDKIEERTAEGETDELQKELDLLAEKITEVLKATNETFMLAAPETLTVKRPNGAFSKQAHIGSEDFAPARAYVGKRGRMIFVFTPVMVAEYTEMEMDENQAREKLMGFKDYLKENMGDVHAMLAEARANAATRDERKSMESRSEAYKDIGFGTW